MDYNERTEKERGLLGWRRSAVSPDTCAIGINGTSMKTWMISLGLTALMSAAVAAQGPMPAEILLGSATAPPGTEVPIDVMFHAPGHSATALALSIEFDASRLTLDTSTTGGSLTAVESLVGPPYRVSSFYFPQSGRIGISIYTDGFITDPLPDGTLARLHLKVQPGAEGFAYVRIAPTPAPEAADRYGSLIQLTATPSSSGVSISPVQSGSTSTGDVGRDRTRHHVPEIMVTVPDVLRLHDRGKASATALTVTNPGDERVDVSFSMQRRSGIIVTAAPIEIEPGEFWRADDVIGALFGDGDAGGILSVVSSRPLDIEARTWHTDARGVRTTDETRSFH